MRSVIILRRTKAIAMVSLMLLSVFVGMNVMSDGPMATGSRFTDGPAVNYTMSVAWYQGSIMTYWNFGPVENFSMNAYQLNYTNGSRPNQTELIIPAVHSGVFIDAGGEISYSPIYHIYYVEVPDNYVNYSLLSEDDCLFSGYNIIDSGLVGVAYALSNNSTLMNDPDPLNRTFIDAMYEGANLTMIGILPPADDYTWYDYNNELANTTSMLEVPISGHKPILNHTMSSSAWSPIVDISGIDVPKGTMTDLYRDHDELLALNRTDPLNFTLYAVSQNLILPQDIHSTPIVHKDAKSVEYQSSEAWTNGQLTRFYDFGVAPDTTTNMYRFVNYTGVEVSQPRLLESVGDGVFNGTAADANYSPFVRIVNVTVPNNYELNYIDDPWLITVLDLPTQVTDEVRNCPTIAKGSTLKNDPYLNDGPRTSWYNYEHVDMFCLGEEMPDPSTLFDSSSGKINTMKGTRINTTGQRQVAQFDNISSSYSPLWDMTYLIPPSIFVEDSIRSQAEVDDVVANNATNGFTIIDGPMLNRPMAATPYAGPPLLSTYTNIKIPSNTGWFDGDHIIYYDMGEYKNKTNIIYELYYNSSGDAVIGQKPIINNIPDDVYQTIPGDSGYTGYWLTYKVMVDDTYEPNSIKNKAEIQNGGYATVTTTKVRACHIVAPSTVFEDYPGTMVLEQFWYKDNPAYAFCPQVDLDQGGYDAIDDEISLNNMYVFPHVMNQSPIVDIVPSDPANYTAMWNVINVSAPSGYMANQIRSATDIESELTDSGSGFTSTDLGMFFRPIVGVVNTSGIAPQADAGVDISVHQTDQVTMNGSASTDNLGIISYTWTFNDAQTPVTLNGPTPTYTFSNMGVFTITLTVVDAENLSDSDTVTVTVLDGIAPVAEAGEDVYIELTQIVRLNGEASTDNVAIVEYHWDFGDNLTSTGMMANHSYASIGKFTVTLNVSDAEGNQGTDTLTVTVVPPNNPPIIDPIPDAEVIEYDTFTYYVIATDIDIYDILTFSLVKGPTGLTIDNATGTISFTPTGDMVGQSFAVEIMVSDGQDNNTRSFSIKVMKAPPSTVIIIVGPITDDKGDPVKGATVELTSGSDSFKGKTDSSGNAQITISGAWLGKTVAVKVKKTGFRTLTFSGDVGATGNFAPTSGSYPNIALEAGEGGPDSFFMAMAVVILIVLAIVLISMRKPPEGLDLDEDEDDEVGDDEDEEEGDEDETIGSDEAE